MHADQIKGKTAIIRSMPNGQGERRPIGYFLRVSLVTGEIIQNVSRVDFEPILAAKPVYATLTLLHITGINDQQESICAEESVRVQVYVDDIAAKVSVEQNAPD